MPTPSVPIGCSLLSAVFAVDGSTANPTITLGVDQFGVFTAAQINAEWRNALTTTSAPFVASSMPTSLSLVETRVLQNSAGTLFSDVDFTVVIGSAVVSQPPMNTAVLINKVTGLAGRKYRGRMFTPPTIAEASVSAAGVITNTVVTNLQTAWTQVFNTLVGDGLTPVLFHGDGSTPTALTGFNVSERIGTIGRRMRR